MQTQLRDLLNRCNPARHHLVIDGYRTSKGDVINYELAVIGSEGYQALVQQSRDLLLSQLLGQRPEEFKPEVWFQAIQEQVASWNKTLAGEHEKKAFAPEQAYGIYSIGDDPDALIIRNLRAVTTTVLSSADKKVVKSQPKTLAKVYIVAHTPMANFVGQLNLAPGKYDNVRIKDR